MNDQDDFETNVADEILAWWHKKNAITPEDRIRILNNPMEFKKIAYEYWTEYFRS